MAMIGRVSFALPVVVAVLTVTLANAAFLPKQWEQLVAEADQIFVGTVVATRSSKLPNGAIVTDVVFASPRIFKGAGGPVTLRVLGGEVGGEQLTVASFPRFEVGITYLAFVKGNGTTILPLVGGPQGLFRVERDPASGDEVVFGAAREALTEPPPRLADFTDAIAEALRR
jgi:hypothetical protein